MTDIAKLAVGRVLGRSLSLWWRNLVPFAVLSGIVHLPSILMIWSGGLPLGPAATADAVYNVLQSSLGLIAHAAITYVMFQQLRGQQARVGESLAAVVPHLGPVLALGIMNGLFLFLFKVSGPETLVSLSLLALLGVYLVYCVTIPVVLVEHAGVKESLERSQSLTRGNRLQILGVVFIVSLLALAAQFLAIRLAHDSHSTGGLWAGSLQLVKYLFLVPLWAASNMAIYQELRAIKDGVDMDALRNFPQARVISPEHRPATDPEQRA